jgi:hypothetical protein
MFADERVSRRFLGKRQKVLERMLQANSPKVRRDIRLPLPGAVTVSLPVVIGRSGLACARVWRGRLDWLVFDGQIRY